MKTLVKTKLTVGKEKKFFYSETNHVSMYDNNDYEKRFANIDDFLNQFQPSKPSENLINRIKEEFFKEAGKITFKPIGFKANQSFYFKN